MDNQEILDTLAHQKQDEDNKKKNPQKTNNKSRVDPFKIRRMRPRAPDGQAVPASN
jgi:ArsR family metal-binding transcriptional regulator